MYTIKKIRIFKVLKKKFIRATGTAETHTKLIYAINAQGELLYTDLAGNPNVYSDDYTVSDTVVSIGG